MVSKKKLLTSICAIAIAAIFSAPSAFAGGWIGEGGGTGFGGGGGGGGACGYYDNMYRADCAGWSWIYYKYVGGASNRNKSVTIYNIAYSGNTGAATISSECAKEGIDGFWHLGQNVQAYSGGTYFAVVNNYHSNAYVAVGGKWGHWNTLTWNSLKSYMPEKTHNGSLGHKLKNGSVIMYQADHSYKQGEVFKDFKVAYQYVKGSSYSGSNFPGGVYAFCYGEGMLSQEATYEGQSSVSGDEGDRSSAGGAYTITFTHKMRMVSKSGGYSGSSNYSTTVSGGGASASGSFSLTNTTFQTLSLGDDKVKVSGTLAPGETKKVCQHLNYDSKVTTSGGTVTGRTPASTSDVCKTVSRKIATFTGSVKGKVGSTENNGSTPVEVDTATATISFEHTIKREGSSDEAGGTASTKYYTTVSGVDANGRDTSPKGTARGSSSSKLETAKISKGDTTTPISYSDESFTVSLLPGETKTFCQTLYYDSVVNAGSGNTSASASACVKVKRKPAECSDGSLYGVDGGKNYGAIQVSKDSGNSWITSSPSTPDGFNYNSRLASAAAWTKPNDKVVFRSQMCEGAEISNQYFNKNISIAYGITASADTYLQDLSTRSWNNSALQGYSNVGKGIFSGNSYSGSAKSPNSSQYVINNSHLGTSFSQSLSWTDLWMTNGNVDTSHNTGGATWTNTATATVYTPYNYTTSLYISTNRAYALAGATADNITLHYAIDSRVNPLVNGSTAYATRSKKTKFQIISFKVGKNVSSSNVVLKDDSARYYADNNGTITFGNKCSSLLPSQASPRDCVQIANIAGGTDSDRIAGDSSIEKSGYSISISDTEEIGTKVCFIGAVWPADSHNLPANTLTSDSNQSGALSEGGSYWHLSEPSCFAVAKKPNFHVLSTGTYSEQNTTAYISKRNNQLFGSWVDYDITAGGAINGIGSGASLWGANAEPFQRACYFSALSFTNSRCNNNEVGYKTVNKQLSGEPRNIYDKIITRYTSDTTPRIDGGYGESGAYELKLEGACDYNEDTSSYEPRGRNGGTTSFSCLSNGTYYTRVNGDAKTENGERSVLVGYDWYHRPIYETYVSQMWTSTDGEHSSNTYVVHVDGTLYINQNFRYGNINDLENTSYTSVSEIPQTLFIARDIKIDSSVTRIDAWLLAENSIDTCYVAGGAAVSVDNCDSQLTITGPVIGKKILLNRTYGGNGGVLSNSQPAEIFDLSPTVYLWSYSQTQRYMQAITTYQREMPTRY